MKLEWLREYRDFTEKLIKFANAYAGMYKQEKYYAKDIAFNSIQLQVMGICWRMKSATTKWRRSRSARHHAQHIFQDRRQARGQGHG